jgi:hypothetical protein
MHALRPLPARFFVNAGQLSCACAHARELGAYGGRGGSLFLSLLYLCCFQCSFINK